MMIARDELTPARTAPALRRSHPSPADGCEQLHYFVFIGHSPSPPQLETLGPGGPYNKALPAYGQWNPPSHAYGYLPCTQK
jgi:hypothetical protein